jgi:hypothetical protein
VKSVVKEGGKGDSFRSKAQKYGAGRNTFSNSRKSFHAAAVTTGGERSWISAEVSPSTIVAVSGRRGVQRSQDGHQTQPMFYNSCSCRRRGRIAHEVKVYVAGRKLEFKTACSHAAAGTGVSELAAGPEWPTPNRRKWIRFKPAPTHRLHKTQRGLRSLASVCA